MREFFGGLAIGASLGALVFELTFGPTIDRAWPQRHGMVCVARDVPTGDCRAYVHKDAASSTRALINPEASHD